MMAVMLSMLASVVLGQESLQTEDEAILLQAARTIKARVGYHNQRAGAMDSCKDSDGVSINQLDSRMMEDCTHKDFHIWHSKIEKAPTYKPGEYAEDDAWRTVKVQEEDGWQSSCVAFVETNKTSCTDWCGVHGLQCVKAMDDAAGRQADLRAWFEAEDYVVSSCSLGEHMEADKIADITGYVSTHGCDLPLNSQICACDTTTTTTVAHPPMLDTYACTTAVNFVPGKYSQISLTDYCPHCSANPKYNQPMGKTYDSNSKTHVEALANALDYCKEECNDRNCSAFFFQKHGNGHEICGFYMEVVDLDSAVKHHGHQECSQVCTRQKYFLGEHKRRTRRPTCPRNSSPVTSAGTCKQSAASLDIDMDFRGSVSRPNFAPGCYHLDAPDHPLSSGIFFNDAGGDWHANTGFRGAVALVCSMDDSMTYGLGVHRTMPVMETEPTCPTNTLPVSSPAQCEEYAKMAGKSFTTANLPNYPRGCSDRDDHVSFAGVWWNTHQVGSWDQHQGFTGEVALVCLTPPSWTQAVAKIGSSGMVDASNKDEATFNELFKTCPVVRYRRNGAVHSVYFRTSPPEVLENPYKLFTDTWSNTDNELNLDFKLFSSFEDATNSANAWQFCNYNDPGVGYPRDCGRSGAVGAQWFSMRHRSPGIVTGVAFDIYTGVDCPVTITTTTTTLEAGWTQAVAIIGSSGTRVDPRNKDEATFNELFKTCPVVRYRRNGAVHSVYFRTSPPEALANPYKLFTDTWSNTDNVLNVDFKLFSSFEDATNTANAWQFCNYNDPGVGYPRDCGRSGAVWWQWFSMRHRRFPGIVTGVAFDIYTGADCPVTTAPPSL